MSSNEIEKWCRRAARLMQSVPEGYEAIVQGGSIDVYPVGTLSAHVANERTAASGIADASECSVIIGNARFYAYTEGA